MKTIKYIIVMMAVLILSCNPQEDEIGSIGEAPTTAEISVDTSDPYNPIFTVNSDRGFTFFWDLGNGQTAQGKTVTAYFPFAGDYNVVCNVYGAGAKSVAANTGFNVQATDPKVAEAPGFKELTNKGLGRTWVYNRGSDGSAPYTYQTTSDLATYPEGWTPGWSWGSSVDYEPHNGESPDVNGEMVFDLNGGVNMTYYQTAGGTGVKGSFILDMDAKTLQIVGDGVQILDYNIDWTLERYTSTKKYQIKLLTDTEMILWQDQYDPDNPYPYGWSWSFKVKE